MFKKIVVSSLLIMAFSFVSSVYATTSEIKASWKSVVEFTDVPLEIEHTPITSLFIPRGFLNAKVRVDLGTDFISADCVLEYELCDASGNLLAGGKGSVAKYDIYFGEDFFVGAEVPPSFYNQLGKIKYRIVINGKKNNGETGKIYFPSDESFITINKIQKYTSDYVTVTKGTPADLKVETGDQFAGNIVLHFDDDALASGSNEFRVRFEEPSAMNMAPGRVLEYALAEWYVEEKTGAEKQFDYQSVWLSSAPVQKEGIAKNFTLQYKRDNATPWEDVVDGEVTYNSEYHTFSCKYIISTGHYRIIASKDLTNGDYRPAKRVAVKGRNGKFVFNNLKQGDSIKIFNTNGKKIKEINVTGSGSSVEWDGTTDSGDWAKSGIYIYQIKVDGKTVNGTIAFVK